jgi:hypothetical protein
VNIGELELGLLGGGLFRGGLLGQKGKRASEARMAVLFIVELLK